MEMHGLIKNPEERSLRENAFSIGDRVVVDRVYTGVVKYIGRVGTKKSESLGVELDSSVGEHNGTRAGRFYFQCKARHGVFRDPKDVRKYRPLEYNQTGLINTTEIEEVSNGRAVSELLHENVEIQRRLEELTKENSRLREELQKERERIKALESAGAQEKENAAECKGYNDGAFGILSEIIRKIKEKIETENAIFNESKM
ncbi:uncharacterized protein NEMAJ01_2094 [Nematocida major]|uniref:uncharacterized protein n=1 Tax=Nematocida major TaxID=1912982 RepID=UPI00200800AD|nr:uncharacterized protein NEMAJ01_2094 [Nematocida major]KAH9387198.1 hypothetical protein NEMAJ01_2094 [Nematocida major]